MLFIAPRGSRGDISTSEDCCPRLDEDLLSAATSNVLQIVKTGISAERRSPRSNYSSQDAPATGECARASVAEGETGRTDRAVGLGQQPASGSGNSQEADAGGPAGAGCWKTKGRLSPRVCEGQQLQRVPVRYARPGAFQEVRLQAQTGSLTGHGG